VRSVWIGGKRDMSPHDQADIFIQHESRLIREIIERGPGPWALTMTSTGIRPLTLRGNPGIAG
jgi:hypothetical protein